MKNFIIILFLLTFTTLLNTANSIFEYSDIPDSWSDGYNIIPPELKNKEITILGQIVDTGVLNIFFIKYFDGNQIISKRIYLDRRILTSVEAYSWYELKGFYQKIEWDKEIFKVIDFTPINEQLKEQIEHAKKTSQLILAKHKKQINLNHLKTKKNLRILLVKDNFHNKDLNKSDFEPDNSFAFFDEKKSLIGIILGKSILGISGRVTLWVQYLCIYEIKLKKVVKIKLVPFKSFERC